MLHARLHWLCFEQMSPFWHFEIELNAELITTSIRVCLTAVFAMYKSFAAFKS